MSSKYWRPQATAVAQVTTIAITAYDVATTYKVTIGGVVVSVLGQGGTTTTTAAALATAINDSTHPYFAALSASNNAGATVTITGIAGLPFTATSSVSGGTGTIGSATEATAATGPYHWDNAENWSDGVVPVDTDDVVVANSSTSILYGLAQSSVALDSLRIEKSFTGMIGLNRLAVATVAAGTTTSSSAPEYRDCYLAIGATVLEIGANWSQDTQTGSGRILINLGTDQSQVVVYDTSKVSTDSGRPAVRLLANNASTTIEVRSAPGGCGVASDVPGETSTIGTLSVSDQSSSSRVKITGGVTITNWTQTGGNNTIIGAGDSTIASVKVEAGTLTVEGNVTLTALEVNGGTVNLNNWTTDSDPIIGTLSLNGGRVATTGASVAQEITTVDVGKDGQFDFDSDGITLTTVTPVGGRMRITASSIS
jgi:hypothetical protein